LSLTQAIAYFAYEKESFQIRKKSGNRRFEKDDKNIFQLNSDPVLYYSPNIPIMKKAAYILLSLSLAHLLFPANAQDAKQKGLDNMLVKVHQEEETNSVLTHNNVWT